ncbi:glycoside hydrolase family 3 N-terminal domain-containing protein [Nakamurella lactea]|uniref:glycoside hydrolase family 3 N-terminal domain-containing protein n=1 Tax=Nakamurella lactea TaxID=459515 RepID=UPI00040F2514|nr:glycoside hydrolase family 3 N-terminal domain-containing protein [Nakamurella lactea]
MPVRTASAGRRLAAVTAVLVALTIGGCTASGESSDRSTAVGSSVAGSVAPSSAAAADTSAAATSVTTARPTATTPRRTTAAKPSTSDPARVTTKGSSTAAPKPTVAALKVTAADHAAAAATVAGMSTTELAGSVIMPIASQADGSIAAQHYGGVILMGTKGIVDGTGPGTPARVKTLVAKLQAQRDRSAGVPLLIGVDQEYGEVARLVHGFTDFPSASELGAIDDTDTAVALTEQSAKAAAAEMRAVGVNVDFAPDADVLPTSGESGIGSRSYGSDPQRVGALVAAAVRGYQSGGVAATIKHFPGIGRVAADTHNELPTLTDDCAGWNATDRVPMAAGVKAGVALVMTGHVLFPAIGSDTLPTSLSSHAVTDILRGKGYGDCAGLEYRGLTVSDSMQMTPVTQTYPSSEAGWRALKAGQDLLLMPLDPQAAAVGIVTAVKDGSLDRTRLTDAATAVLALRIASARVAQPPMSVIDSPEHRALAAKARAAG